MPGKGKATAADFADGRTSPAFLAGDYTGGNELWKYQWDFIHDPEGGWFIFEDSEEGAAVLLGGLHYQNNLLEDNHILYYFPQKSQMIELVAGKLEDGVINQKNVKWIHNDIEESEKFPVLTIDINQQYFADKESIEIIGNQTFGPVTLSSKKVILERINIDANEILEAYCDNIIQLMTLFNELKESIEIPEHIDPIIFANIQAAYSRGMSSITYANNEIPDDDVFNQTLYQMHAIDTEMDEIEDYDILYIQAVEKRNDSELWIEFFNDVMSALPYLNPLENKETFEEVLQQQILEKAKEVLLNYSNN